MNTHSFLQSRLLSIILFLLKRVNLEVGVFFMGYIQWDIKKSNLKWRKTGYDWFWHFHWRFFPAGKTVASFLPYNSARKSHRCFRGEESSMNGLLLYNPDGFNAELSITKKNLRWMSIWPASLLCEDFSVSAILLKLVHLIPYLANNYKSLCTALSYYPFYQSVRFLVPSHFVIIRNPSRTNFDIPLTS